jgi:hypothetical protein
MDGRDEPVSLTPARGANVGSVLLRFLLGQIGSRSEREAALGMLLTTSDLPGDGWTQLSQRHSRSLANPFVRRPRLVSIQAHRKFRQEVPPRGLHLGLVVFDSEMAAEKQIRFARTGYVRYQGVTTVEEREIHDVEVPEVTNPYLWERKNVRGDQHGFARSVSARVENVALLVTGSAGGDGWVWDDVASIATSQGVKIKAQSS